MGNRIALRKRSMSVLACAKKFFDGKRAIEESRESL
jgi:hypothetical protein